MLLTDKVIIVTGAGQGIGVAYAHGLSDKGARVVLADVNLEGVRKVAAEIEAKGGQVLALKVDVTNPRDVEVMVGETVARYGRVDALVNNAAISSQIEHKMFWELSPEEFDRILSVNVKGTWLCSRAVFDQMKQQGGGKIVNISSSSFFDPPPTMTHYVTSKGGVIGLTRAMAREAGQFNINVNSVAPGFTVTDIMAQLRPDAATYAVDEGCLKRSEQPEDLVGAVAFLCSSESDFITGQTIVVDGGRNMH